MDEGWTPNTLKHYIDRTLDERQRALDRGDNEQEKRFASMEARLSTLQNSWHERFIAFERAFESRLDQTNKLVQVLGRIVYIGLGVALAVEAALQFVKH